jgi:triosephosphate isomerase
MISSILNNHDLGGAMRKPIIAGNWKMNLGQVDEALDFIRQIRHPLNEISGVERVLCPPFTTLHAVSELLSPLSIELGAQNMHWEESGAHTGEISPGMLDGLCQYVILGHSERRATMSNEDGDLAINKKVLVALAHNLKPIVCVGENLAQNEAGETHDFVSNQISSALKDVPKDRVTTCVVAYEPIWAIGTGKAATPTDANRTIALSIRGTLSELYDEASAQKIRVQYGGSVKVDNIQSFMAMPDIDGALVGGASLKTDFVELVRNAVS